MRELSCRIRCCGYSEMGSRGYNRLYDKFCTIVMYGSYNWTSTANDSEEILGTTLDH